MSSVGETVPEEPQIIRIVPTKGWVGLKLPELWEYRELLYYLTWRDLKVRYKQTALGAAWAILQPVLTMVVFTIVFGRVAKVDTGHVPYPIFSFTALLPWTFFLYGLTNSAGSMVANTAFITKVYFPRLTIPIAPVLSGFADFLLSCIVMGGLMAYYGVVPSARIIIAMPLLVLAAAAALGAGLWLAALNIKYRDIKYVVPFLGNVWLFATPIAYSATGKLSGAWRLIYAINPLVGVVDGFRWGVLGVNNAPGIEILIGTVSSFIMLVIGAFYFRRTERDFADVA